ncbi:unnamed protein product, partial [Rotaria sordida]
MNKCQCSMDELEYLLSLTPSLVYLKLISYRKSKFDFTSCGTYNRQLTERYAIFDPALFDGLRWKQFIQTKLFLLKQFQFFFSNVTNIDNSNISATSLIIPFQRSFWLDQKHWSVNCDEFLGIKEIQLYTTPIRVNDLKNGIIYQVSAMNMKSRIIFNITNDIDNNNDLNNEQPTLYLACSIIRNELIPLFVDTLYHDK